jgi:myosin-1
VLRRGAAAESDQRFFIAQGNDVTDDMLLEALSNHRPVSNHAHFDSRNNKKSLTDKRMHHGQFRVHHYAGDVIYTIAGFAEKNRDTLWTDVTRFLHRSKLSILQDMFSEDGTVNENGTARAGKRPPTLGSQFKASIATLMLSLSSKNPHYIRCIKPNSAKKAREFDTELVLHQIQ